MDTTLLVKQLNDDNSEVRLNALSKLKKLTDEGKLSQPPDTIYVNNHIHTVYSFSPYSPTKAIYMAWQEGLKTAGIMDHDTVCGAKEFLEAAKIIGMPVTVGFECRVNMAKTRLNGKRINNPDQRSVAYAAVHGIPHQYIDAVDSYLEPFRKNRIKRNIKMCENISALVEPYGFTLDFEKDVLPLSYYHQGGTVTERHILYAFAKKVTAKYPTPAEVIDFFKNEMKIDLSPKAEKQIAAGKETPQFYEYDILGPLKSNMVEKFYIDATDECPEVHDFVGMASKYSAISAYAYLGDVVDSVTGDKKAQSFEDSYLDLLFEELKKIGFDAITYMPTRNTPQQLTTIMKYCKDHEFLQISGVDINSPRQKFICEELDNPLYAHLIDATYALIGAENCATKDPSDAMFSEKTIHRFPQIKDRIDYFKNKV